MTRRPRVSWSFFVAIPICLMLLQIMVEKDSAQRANEERTRATTRAGAIEGTDSLKPHIEKYRGGLSDLQKSWHDLRETERAISRVHRIIDGIREDSLGKLSDDGKQAARYWYQLQDKKETLVGPRN